MINKMPKVKYKFVIKEIDVGKINNKYFNDEESPEEIFKVSDKTKITDLRQDQTITYLGHSKQVHKCNISMIDFNSCKEVTMLKYHCFWCRFPFSNQPIGCPTSFTPSKKIIKYKSAINQHEYSITEPSCDPGDNSFYKTDGVFCSFNCCMAFINDNNKNPLYSNSANLLSKLYTDIYNIRIKKINPAPHWRTIVQYGGFMNINQFRDSFEKIEYNDHGTISIDIDVNMLSRGILFEKRLKF